MTEEILEGVSPTRMDLLETRKKLVLAGKGHKLLEEKRDALVERFFQIIEKRNTLVTSLAADFSQAFGALIEAQMLLGEDKVEAFAQLTGDIGEFSFKTDNIMGVKIPGLNRDGLVVPQPARYGFFESCSRLDDAHQRFNELMVQLLELAEIEGGIKSLATEIEKTKRRVNVLENNLIPKLKATIKYIEMQLEEREREDFFRRKRIKAILEAKKQ
jgi:V/A-type H+-transporting ATPase subunit D